MHHLLTTLPVLFAQKYIYCKLLRDQGTLRAVAGGFDKEQQLQCTRNVNTGVISFSWQKTPRSEKRKRR